MTQNEIKDSSIKHLQVRLSTDIYDGLRHMAVKRKMSMQQLAEQTFKELLMHPENKAIRDIAGINEKDPDEVWKMFKSHASHNFKSAVDGIIQAWVDSSQNAAKQNTEENTGQ